MQEPTTTTDGSKPRIALEGVKLRLQCLQLALDMSPENESEAKVMDRANRIMLWSGVR